LAELDPGHAGEYRARAEELDADARQLDAELAGKLAPLKGSAMYTFHPTFGYFARAYGMEQVSIESGGREPSAKRLTKLVEGARKDRVKLVLVQPQHPRRGADRVAQAIGAEVVELDPLAKDVFGTMRSLAELLLKARQ
jgi:zinc transport system substrate-binding protein